MHVRYYSSPSLHEFVALSLFETADRGGSSFGYLRLSTPDHSLPRSSPFGNEDSRVTNVNIVVPSYGALPDAMED